MKTIDWISIKDRLPEAGTLVVILHDDAMNLNHRKPPVYFGRHNGKYWLQVTDHSDVMWPSHIAQVSHWMPLPAPPKEEK